MKNKITRILALWSIIFITNNLHAEEGPCFGNGIHNGWANQHSIVIWTRLTKHPEMNVDGKPFLLPSSQEIKQLNKSNDTARQLAVQLPEGATLEDMEGACPGMPGEVRLSYWLDGKSKDAPQYPWQAVDNDKDFTTQWTLTNLQAGTSYQVLLEARKIGSSTITSQCTGRFKTAPNPDTPCDVNAVIVTCHDYPRRDADSHGHFIYPSIAALKPDFFVHTGDVEYYDKPYPYAWTESLMRFTWNRLFALPFQRDFYTNHTCYFMKDDHDTLKDDCWPGQTYGSVTFERGCEIFDREQFPSADKTYQTVRWGKDLQFWVVEGRNYRSPNTLPDGPEKTIWGPEQKAWFFKTVQESDATFKILITPTPILGPDRDNKHDNYSNKNFKYEGDEIRAFIDKHKMFIVNGDRHWQYVTHLDDTHLWEFSTGPGSDRHAEGWNPEDKRPQHRFLRVKGGFLGIHITRKNNKPTIAFRHYDVFGLEVHEEPFNAD